jgi:hypothetical protein
LQRLKEVKVVRTTAKIVMGVVAALFLSGGGTGAAQELTQIASESGVYSMVGIDAQGTVYSISLPLTTRPTLTEISGNLSQVSAWAEIWGVNTSHDLFRYNSTSKQWTEMETGVLSVAVVKSSATHVFAVKTDGTLQSWNGSGWTKMNLAPEGTTQIAAGDSSAEVYAVTSTGRIYKLDGESWIGLHGSLKTISVGMDGTIGGIGLDGLPYVRTAADVAADINGSKTTPTWLAPVTMSVISPLPTGIDVYDLYLQRVIYQGQPYQGAAGPPVLRLGQTVTAPYLCDLGLVVVNNTCQKPSLLPTICEPTINGKPTNNEPCCTGLKLEGGVCVRTPLLTCTATEIQGCCFGTDVKENTCSCYCPSTYYVGS